jgi:hypothetical protein
VTADAVLQGGQLVVTRHRADISQFVVRRLAIAALVILSSVAICDAGNAGVRITIDYEEVKTEVSPEQKTFTTNESRVYTVHGNSLDFVGSGGFKTSSGMRLGKELAGETDHGSRFKLTYKIVDGAIVVSTEFPTFTTVRRITTDNKTSCASTLEYKKKPSHNFFEVLYLGRNLSFSDMRAENITCSIAEVAD